MTYRTKPPPSASYMRLSLGFMPFIAASVSFVFILSIRKWVHLWLNHRILTIILTLSTDTIVAHHLLQATKNPRISIIMRVWLATMGNAGKVIGTPKGIRTPVTTVKGWCPRPLDDGSLELKTIKSKILLFIKYWYFQGESNPSSRRERAVS